MRGSVSRGLGCIGIFQIGLSEFGSADVGWQFDDERQFLDFLCVKLMRFIKLISGKLCEWRLLAN